MRLVISSGVDTVTVSPLEKRKRFPPIARIEKEGNRRYLVPVYLFDEKIWLCDLPDDYETVKISNYEIVFKAKAKRTKSKKLKSNKKSSK